MLKKIFWDGLKTFVPIVVTISIVVWIFSGIESFFGHFLRHIIPPKYYFDGLGIIVGIVIIFILGFLVKSWMVRQIYGMGERLVQRIPFIKSIYNAVQDLLGFFDKSQQAQQAVMVQTQLGNIIGFITRESLSQMTPALGKDDEVLVYIPLSYMVGGITMVIPRHLITPLNWSVNEAMSFILTAGMGGQSANVAQRLNNDSEL